MTTEQKNQHLDQLREEFSHITDRLGKPIDAGIFETVVILNALGFHTTSSCEGHLDWGLAGPWIDLNIPTDQKTEALYSKHKELLAKADAEEAKGTPMQDIKPLFDEARAVIKEARTPLFKMIENLIQLLTEYYSQHLVSYQLQFTINEKMRSIRFQPISLILQDICSPEDRKQNLEQFQQEMKLFTEFLKQKYYVM